MNKHFISTRKKTKVNSQKYIAKYLSGLNLNEFIQRIELNIFKNHIFDALKLSKMYPMLNEDAIIIDLKFNTNDELNLYVYFNENTNEKAHLTMHLTGIDYGKDKVGPFHLKIKNQIELRKGKFINAYSIIKVNLVKNNINLKYNNTNFYYNTNLSNEFYNYKPYKIVLSVINEYLKENGPLSLTKDISQKREIHHPYYIKANDVKMSKTYFSKRLNGSKTLKQCELKEYKPFAKLTISRKSRSLLKNLSCLNGSNKYKNYNTGILYNKLKLNKNTKKNIKKSLQLYIKNKHIIVNNVTATI